MRDGHDRDRLLHRTIHERERMDRMDRLLHVGAWIVTGLGLIALFAAACAMFAR